MSPAAVGRLQTNPAQELWLRWQRAFAEFLWLPLAMMTGLVVLGVIAAVVDTTSPPWLGGLEQWLPGDAASTVISTGAQAVVSVTAITFSVLLLAIQQAASTLSPVVSDQFLRRKPNQVYFGFFGGVSTYSFLVLALSPPDRPLFSAALALVLSAIAFPLLVLHIYGTVDQNVRGSNPFGRTRSILALTSTSGQG